MSDLKLINEYGGAVRRFAVVPTVEGGEQLESAKAALLRHCESQSAHIAELEASVLKITADCNAVVCGKSDRITELEAEVARLRVDGERWQAFLNCGCVKLFGWAGVNNKPGEPSYNEVGYVHFGGEFWTNAFEEKYYSAADKAQAQEVLIAFADGAIKTAQLAAKESA